MDANCLYIQTYIRVHEIENGGHPLNHFGISVERMSVMFFFHVRCTKRREWLTDTCRLYLLYIGTSIDESFNTNILEKEQ